MYRGKRAVDLALTAVAALPAAAVGAVCAVAVKLDSPGPVLFRQQRIGKHGQPFEVLKFRTMVHADNPLFPDPAVITRSGRVLRRLSLDELPQLLNVVRGQMSVVGPRPTFGYQVQRYDARQLGRLQVKPGLTGLAQVRGRNSLPWSERIDWDLRYVQQQSLGLDLRILIESARVVLTGDGVGGHPVDDLLAAPADEAAAA